MDGKQIIEKNKMFNERDEYPFFNEFYNYLDGKGKPSKYIGYVRTIYNKILEEDHRIIFAELEKCVAYYNKKKKPNEGLKGLKLVSNFIRRIYSLTRIESKIGERASSFLGAKKIKKGCVKDYATALDLYITSINEYQNSKDYKKPPGFYKIGYSISNYNNACKKLNSVFHDKISVNGIDSLLAIFKNGNSPSFISYILSNSFFFSQILAKDQFKDIAEKIINKDEERPFARNSGRDKTAKHGEIGEVECLDENNNSSKTFEIKIDGDGNKAVRELIETKTGYTLSSGENCLFTNYIISHIWGDAFDPRNFTNFWNLALVPSWANPLLDKQNYENNLAKQLLNTFKAICMKLYGMNSNYYNWKSIFKKCPPLDPNKVVIGDYNIHVINQRRKKNGIPVEPYGRIEVRTISINSSDIDIWKQLFQ